MILFQIMYPSLFFVLVIEFQVFNLVHFYPYTNLKLLPSLTLHVISLYTKLLLPKFQDVSFVFQMPKQTAISINFKIPPPSLSFTSLFPHSLKNHSFVSKSVHFQPTSLAMRFTKVTSLLYEAFYYTY